MKRAFLLLLVAGAALAEQQPQGDDPVSRQLFPPELIMANQEDLQLQEKQRATIRSEVVKLQGKVVDLQWQLSEDAEKLAAALRAAPVDEAKALALADKVMAQEREVKRLHLAMLIRIKNALTPEQTAKLHEIRKRSR